MACLRFQADYILEHLLLQLKVFTIFLLTENPTFYASHSKLDSNLDVNWNILIHSYFEVLI